MTKQVIILDQNDLNFVYTAKEIRTFRRVWKRHRQHKNKSLFLMNEIAEELDMTPDNLFLLALDQIKKRKIK